MATKYINTEFEAVGGLNLSTIADGSALSNNETKALFLDANGDIGYRTVGTAAFTSSGDYVSSSNLDDYLPLAGGTMTGSLQVSVGGALGINIKQDTGTSTQSGRLFFSNDTSGQGVSIYNTSGAMRFQTGATFNSSTGSTRMIIGTGGNVGIGTTSPGFTNGGGLEIEKSGTATLRLQSAGSNASEIFQTTTGFTIADLSSGVMAFRVSNTEGMRLTSTGLGIGTTSPSTKLHVDGTLTADVGHFGITGSNPQIQIYTQDASTNIADTFSDTTTDKSYIYFQPGTSSNDPGYIMHETSDYETNSGVIHLAPSDDNADSDYVSIHGTNDPDALRLTTAGLIETASNYQLRLKSGSGNVKVNDDFQVTGNVGIGTDSPAAKLDVSVTPSAAWMNLINGSETAFRLTSYNNGTNNGTTTYAFKHGLYYNTTENAAVTFYRGGGSTGGFLTFTTNAGSERMRIDHTGNVGIGTTSPDYKLDVAGDVGIDGYIYHNGDDSRIGFEGNDAIRMYTANSVRLQIQSDGNVGIGTTSPSAKLHVSGDVQIGSSSQANSYGALQVNQTSNVDEEGIAILSASLGRSIRIWVDETKSYINSGDGGSGDLILNEGAGKVGIGTTAPTQKLQVIGDISLGKYDATDFDRRVGLNSSNGGYSDGSSYIRFQELSATGTSGTTKGCNIRFYNHLYAGGTNETLTIQANGYVGIGTTSPSYKLDVSGDIRATGDLNAGDDVFIAGNTLRFTNDAASAYIQSVDTLYIEADSNINDTGGKPIIFRTAGTTKMTIAGDGDVTIDNDLIVSGDLTVSGTTTTLDTATLQVEDHNIEIGNVTTPSNTTANNGGITLLGGTDGDKKLTWIGSSDAWVFNTNLDVQGDLGVTGDFEVTGTTTLARPVLVNGAHDNNGAADFAVDGGTQISLYDGQVQMGGTDMNWNSKFYYDSSSGANIAAWDRNITIFSTGTNSGTAAARDIIFSPQTSGTAASTERMRIKGSGNVGIGTTSPAQPLHVKGAALRLEEASAARHLDIVPAVSGVNHRLTSTTTGAGFDFEYWNGSAAAVMATISSGGITATGSVKSEGPDGGMVMREWQNGSSYGMIGTANMTGAEYCLLTDGTDTYISGGSGGSVYLRGGGNDTAPQVRLTTSNLRFHSIPSLTSEATALVWEESSGNVGYRELGSNAFNSTTIPSAANNATITLQGGGGITTTIGDFTTDQSSNETLTISHADTSGQSSVNNSNGTVIQDVTLDTYGHVTYLASANLDNRYARGKTVEFNSVDTDNGTDDWYKIFRVEDQASTPVEAHLRGYAHSSISFIVSEGYQGGSAHINILDAHVNSVNNSYKYIEGVRVFDNGDVEVKLNGGSSVSLELTIIGDATVVSEPTLSTYTGTVRDSITSLSTGMIRSYGSMKATEIELSSISAAASDTDKFLVSDNGLVKYRTGSQVLSDIGGLSSSGGGMSGAIDMNNNNIVGVNFLSFEDPGPSEGLTWTNGNIKIFESPDDLTTNSAGNLQVTYGGTRRLTVNSTGVDVNGDLDVGSVFDFNTSTDLLTITNNQNTGGINLSGGNSRIYFSGYRAIEGQSNGSNLYIGEGYGQISLMDNTSVTGNITVSGTVDGRDVAADGSKLDGIAAGANNYTHPTHPGDDFSVDSGPLTGATVISDIDINVTTDTLGHVTDANGTIATRTLTAANLGISAPNAPSNVSVSVVGETVSVSFDASTTSGIDSYLVYSSVDGSDYGLISIIPPDDFSATMEIIDQAFAVTGTQAYRVYAMKYGIMSSAATGSVSYTVSSAEPTDMTVVPLNNAYFVQWNPPSSNERFVTAYNVYKHEAAQVSSLARGSASLVYSGLNTNFMYQISGSNNNNYHQFWVETTIA